MLVRDWMTANVISLGVNSSIMDAAEILREKNIRQFPVIDRNGTLVGIVSDRDIRDALPSKFIPGDVVKEHGGGLYTLTAGDIMTLDPYTVSSGTPLNEVADILARHKIGGLPVVDGGELVGIITQLDVLRFLSSASGAKGSVTQFALRLEKHPCPLADLLVELRSLGLNCTSVFTACEGGARNAYIRLDDLGDHSVEQVVEILQRQHTLLYYVNEGITVDLR